MAIDKASVKAELVEVPDFDQVNGLADAPLLYIDGAYAFQGINGTVRIGLVQDSFSSEGKVQRKVVTTLACSEEVLANFLEWATLNLAALREAKNEHGR